MDNKPAAGLMMLAAFLGAFGGMNLSDDESPYYCESRDLICIGHRLSDSTKTCYYLVNETEKGARCTEGWTYLSPEPYKPSNSVEIYANNCIHTCTYQDTLKSYDTCTCDNGQFAYAGELI